MKQENERKNSTYTIFVSKAGNISTKPYPINLKIKRKIIVTNKKFERIISIAKPKSRYLVALLGSIPFITNIR